MNDDELTPSERKAMEGLPRERMPSALLRKRTVNALHHRGVLRSAKRRYFEATVWRVVWACAASIVLVAGGFALGQWTGARRGANGATSLETGDLPIAATVQQAGTAYVSALGELAAWPDSTNSKEMFQGREVALNALYAAAHEMIHIVPNDVLADQILSALEDHAASGPSSGIDEEGRRIIWF